ncbi:MAG TPA: hypothetical protein PK761_03305 [Clostridia bacterium]|nr:hypothetical protein [Clostridia bacterium]HPL07510.1 hypothetical protein [Clostridia bacterium]
MNFFSNSLVYFIKKPLIPIYTACISLVCCIIMIFNPAKLLSKYYSSFISDDIGDTVIMFSKWAYKYTHIPYILLGILALAIVLALLSSLVFSGYMNIIHLTVKRIKTDFSHYLQGLKKGFFRCALVFFQMYLSLLLFVAFIPLAFTPFFILKNSVADAGHDPTVVYILLAVLIFIIIAIFILIYMTFAFKFPSIFHFSRYPIEKANAAVNARYWRTFAKSALLLLFLAGVLFVMYKIENKVLEFLVGFVLYTIYFSFFAVFPFYTFDKLIEPYRVNS